MLARPGRSAGLRRVLGRVSRASGAMPRGRGIHPTRQYRVQLVGKRMRSCERMRKGRIHRGNRAVHLSGRLPLAARASAPTNNKDGRHETGHGEGRGSGLGSVATELSRCSGVSARDGGVDAFPTEFCAGRPNAWVWGRY